MMNLILFGSYINISTPNGQKIDSHLFVSDFTDPVPRPFDGFKVHIADAICTEYHPIDSLLPEPLKAKLALFLH